MQTDESRRAPLAPRASVEFWVGAMRETTVKIDACDVQPHDERGDDRFWAICVLSSVGRALFVEGSRVEARWATCRSDPVTFPTAQHGRTTPPYRSDNFRTPKYIEESLPAMLQTDRQTIKISPRPPCGPLEHRGSRKQKDTRTLDRSLWPLRRRWRRLGSAYSCAAGSPLLPATVPALSCVYM